MIWKNVHDIEEYKNSKEEQLRNYMVKPKKQLEVKENNHFRNEDQLEETWANKHNR